MKIGAQSAAAILVLSASFAISVPVSAAEFVPLGHLSTSGALTYSIANAISADGSTVVGISVTSASQFDAFRWTRAGGMIAVGMPRNTLDNVAAGVSGDGTYVVGDRFNSANNGNIAFRHAQATGAVDLGLLPGLDQGSATIGPFTIVGGISADGTKIVGRGSGDISNGSGIRRTEAFLWNNGVMTGLGTLTGGTTSSSAGAISGDGTTIVGSSDVGSGLQAFRKHLSGPLVALGDLAGGSVDSHADVVSYDGSFVAGRGRSANGREGFRWSQTDGMVGLGDLPGGIFQSTPTGITADGATIVGFSAVGTTAQGGTLNNAFIWDAQHGMRNLKSVLTDMGLDLTGWTLLTASGMTPDGSTIVGTALNPQGLNEAYLVAIPEPASPAIAALVTSGLLGRRRRR